MNTTKFSNILLDKSPKKINAISEGIIDTLFEINEVVRELNSVDFCNPLGYLLTKALPPDGLIDNKLKQYGKKVKEFINKSTKKLELNNTSDITNDLEEIRLSLEDIIPDEELKNIIPGGDGILKVIQNLNDSLVIANTSLSINDKKILLQSFINRLTPLSNPVSLTEILLGAQVGNLNKKLNNIIKPERFKNDLLRLIKLIIKIDKSIKQIQNTVNLINKIIKSINVLIKILKLSIKILKAVPIPAKFVTVGNTVTASSKVNKFENEIIDLNKILNSVSTFLKTTITKQIRRIRNEIFILLVGLNQLLENLSACKYFEGDILLGEIKNGIISLENNIITLEELFPEIIDNTNNNGPINIYKGYNIIIIKEETTDNNTTLLRRRIIVTNQQGIIEYEGTPTYSNKDQILIKEGQFYIDSKNEVSTSDKGTDNLSNEDISKLVNQMGLEYTSDDDLSQKENEVNNILYNQIQNNPEDKKLYNSLIGDNSNLNPKNIELIKKIINSLSNTTNTNLLQIRIKQMVNSLIQKGFKLEEINEALKFQYSNKFNIIIENNNIKISSK